MCLWYLRFVYTNRKMDGWIDMYIYIYMCVCVYVCMYVCNVMQCNVM